MSQAGDGHLPPHNLHAERTVLSEAMQTVGVMDDLVGWLRPEDFYSEAHRRIFEAALEVYTRDRSISLATVGVWLKETDRLQQIGGHEYLAEVYHSTAAVVSVLPLAKVVRDHARLRMFTALARGALARCYVDPTPSIIDEVARDCADLADDRTDLAAKPIRDAMKRAIERIRLASESGGVSGLSTGLVDIDRATAGLHDGDLVIVAGRPGMGKSALGFQIFAHVAEQGHGTLGFSLEMPDDQIAMRLALERARISIEKGRSGRLSPQDWSALTEASIDVAGLPAFLDDRPALSLAQVRSSARRTQRMLVSKGKKLRLIVVDYLQLARHEAAQSREQEVAEVSRGLKELAKELALPVVALAQLNRKCEERSNKRPMLSDLRDSGSIEQDADVIVFIYRDELYNPRSPDKGIAEIIVSKQRNGPLGAFPVAFNAAFTSFANLDETTCAAWENRNHKGP